MKIIGAIAGIAVTAYLLGLFLPWWSIAPAAFGVSLFFGQRSLSAFVSGFLGVFLLWAGMATWIDHANNSLLSARIASVLPLEGNVTALIFLTGAVGGIVAGLAALAAGFLTTPARRRTDTQNYYRNRR